jgi:hypothetical protein
LFQRFTVVVNNMRANVDVLPYDGHDRAVKLLHSLDPTIWGGKFEAIVESEKYDTLTVDELFSKLKSAEVDRGMTANLEAPTDSHSLALIGGSKGKANTNPSTRMFTLSSLMSMPDEEFDVLGEDELALPTRRFERLHENRVNMRRNTRTCFQCGKPGHFVADCPEKFENKDGYEHKSRNDGKYRSMRDHESKYKNKHKDERRSRKKESRGKAPAMVGVSDVDSSSVYATSSSSSSEDEGDRRKSKKSSKNLSGPSCFARDGFCTMALTLFLLRQGRDILIVLAYVDDIVFGGSSNSLVERFAEDMSREFEMSMMGELQFFLGLQIKQSKKGTFVHQAKYTKDIVRKFKMEDSKAMTTPMSTTRLLMRTRKANTWTRRSTGA